MDVCDFEDGDCFVLDQLQKKRGRTRRGRDKRKKKRKKGLLNFQTNHNRSKNVDDDDNDDDDETIYARRNEDRAQPSSVFSSSSSSCTSHEARCVSRKKKKTRKKEYQNSQKTEKSNPRYNDDKSNTRKITNSKLSYSQHRKGLAANLRTVSCNSDKFASSFRIPKDLTSPTQLKWHKEYRVGSSIPVYQPCHIIEYKPNGQKSSQSATMLEFSSSDSSSDDDDEVKVEYLASFRDTGTANTHSHHKAKSNSASASKYVKRISKKRLIPYHNQVSNHGLDYNDIMSSKWCTQIYDLYQKQSNQKQSNYMSHMNQQKKLDVASLEELNHILDIAKERGGYNPLSTSEKANLQYESDNRNKLHDDNEDDDLDEPHDDLDEPYTQANLYKNQEMNSDEEEMQELLKDITKQHYKKDKNNDNLNLSSTSSHSKTTIPNNQSNEPIKPGDVIEYFSPIYVMGDERGRRITTVISVNPNNKNSNRGVIKVNNDEYLPLDLKIRRIKTLIHDKYNNKKTTLIDHPGIYRQIEEFKLVKLNPIDNHHIQTERDRVKNILCDQRKIFEKKVIDSGFAPMDMIRTFGSNRNDTTKLRRKEKLSSSTTPSHEETRKNITRLSSESKAKHSNRENDSLSSSSDSDCDLSFLLSGSGQKKRNVKKIMSNSHVQSSDSSSSDETSIDLEKDDSSSCNIRKVTKSTVTTFAPGQDLGSFLYKDNKKQEPLQTKFKANKPCSSSATRYTKIVALSLRDTDEEADNEEVNTNDLSRPLSHGSNDQSNPLHNDSGMASLKSRLVFDLDSSSEEDDKLNRMNKKTTNRQDSKEKQGLFSLELGISSDSDDDYLDPASFLIKKHDRLNSKAQQESKNRCNKHIINNASGNPTKKTVDIKRRGGHAKASFAELDFQSSESEESIHSSSSSLHKIKSRSRRNHSNSNEDCSDISEDFGCMSNKKVNVSHTADRSSSSPLRYHSSPKPIKIDKSRFSCKSTSHEKIGSISKTIPQIHHPEKRSPIVKPSLRFKVFKHNN